MLGFFWGVESNNSGIYLWDYRVMVGFINDDNLLAFCP